AREYDVDVIVWKNEAGSAGVGRDVDRDRPLALGQDRGHVAGALGLDQPRLADWLAFGEGLARDRSGELIDGVRIVAPADELRARGFGRPRLPAQVLARHRAAEPDVAAGDEDVNRLDLRDRRKRRPPFIRSPSQKSGNAAGSHGDDQNNDTRGFHDASLSTNHAATGTVRNSQRVQGPETRPLHA